MSKSAEPSSRRADILVTLVMLCGGLAGFAATFSFPGRAGIWPMFVTGVFCALIAMHLVVLWRNRPR